jgi:protein CpxP
MKKLLLVLFVAALASTATFAQDGAGGGDRAARGKEMREAMRTRLKDELKLTDVQADSVMSIQQDFQMKNRAIRQDQALSDDDKKAKTKDLETERNKKLKGILSDEQMTKLEAYNENMRKMREQRQGQGGGQRQN